MARLLAHLIAALQNKAPGVGEAALALLRSPEPPAAQAVLTALLNDVAAHGAPLLLVLDDWHAAAAAAAMLELRDDIAVVGEATTGAEAVALAEHLQPDVVLMDLQMPGLNGIEATRQIVATSPSIRVLVVTMFEDDASVFAAMRAGARGYVLKDSAKAEIVRAIQAAGNGEAIFSPAIANRLLAFFAAPRPQVTRAIFPELTEREREILHLIATGAPNGSIAQQLSLSPKTVSNYVSNIFAKLQVADRAEAIIKARDAGLGGGAA